MLNFGYDDADDFAALVMETQGERVGLIVEFVGDVPDRLLCFGADVGVVFQCPRYRGSRNSKFAGYVLDGRLAEWFHNSNWYRFRFRCIKVEEKIEIAKKIVKK